MWPLPVKSPVARERAAPGTNPATAKGILGSGRRAETGGDVLSRSETGRNDCFVCASGLGETVLSLRCTSGLIRCGTFFLKKNCGTVKGINFVF